MDARARLFDILLRTTDEFSHLLSDRWGLCRRRNWSLWNLRGRDRDFGRWIGFWLSTGLNRRWDKGARLLANLIVVATTFGRANFVT